MIEVSAGGAELVDTTTTSLSKSFTERQVVELAQINVGGAVGGQRPRNNNLQLDGVDNNRKDVTGPTVYISPENVAEFSLLQNQFSAEFARSNGGQFITVTKSGTKRRGPD